MMYEIFFHSWWAILFSTSSFTNWKTNHLNKSWSFCFATFEWLNMHNSMSNCSDFWWIEVAQTMKKNLISNKWKSKICSERQKLNLSVKTIFSSSFQEKRVHQLDVLSRLSFRISCRLCRYISTSFHIDSSSFSDIWRRNTQEIMNSNRSRLSQRLYMYLTWQHQVQISRLKL